MSPELMGAIIGATAGIAGAVIGIIIKPNEMMLLLWKYNSFIFILFIFSI